MAVIFSDGQVGSTMETLGDFSAWTSASGGGAGTLNVSNDWAREGTNSAKHVLPGSTDYTQLQKNVAVTTDRFNMRCYFKFTSWNFIAGDWASLLFVYQTMAFSWGSVGIFNDTHNLYYGRYTGAYNWAYVQSATTISLDTVYALELETIRNGGSYQANIYLNGAIVNDLTLPLTPMNGCAFWAPDQFYFSMQDGGPPGASPYFTMYNDSFVIDDANYIGTLSETPALGTFLF